MKLKPLMSKLVFAGALVATSTAYADDSYKYDYATVLTSEPIVKVFHTSVPEQECWEERAQVRSSKKGSATGTILGTLVGAAIGNAVGHNKTNKRVGAVAGAILGGSIAADANRGANRHQSEWVTRCETIRVSSEEERVIGYRVTYLYNGETYTTRLNREPGNSLKIRIVHTPVID